MAKTLNDCIDHLRRRSRHLLAQVDENSKKIKNEIKKIYSNNVTQQENYCNSIGERNLCYKGNIKSWKLRNDSSGVNGVLHPDYTFKSTNNTLASMPNISTSKRVSISSKKRSEGQCCSENICRKPIKECYCYPEFKKIQLRSSRTQHKQNLSCKNCKSHIDFNSAIATDNPEKSHLNSPISCETLRRVQKIDYAPRSQFLRNVQSKVSLLQGTATGDCPEMCSRSSYYHELISRKNMHNVDSVHQIKNSNKETQTNIQSMKPTSLSEINTNLEHSEEEQYSESDNVNTLTKEVQTSLKKQSRPKLVTKRTLSSKKSVPDLKKTKSNVKTSTKNKRTSQLLNKECTCSNNKLQSSYKSTLETDTKRSSTNGDYQHTVSVNNRQEETDEEFLSDDEVKKLRNFREQNYFDTHGSSQTLLSSKSLGSLEQYLLNDRLFPEPTKRVHKKDLVVTMPPCATVQRRRIHYFPRYIVRQEKNNCNINYKKKRYQSCPLTGHAIDLGVTKIRPPLNSLALKYQKRLT